MAVVKAKSRGKLRSMGWEVGVEMGELKSNHSPSSPLTLGTGEGEDRKQERV